MEENVMGQSSTDKGEKEEEKTSTKEQMEVERDADSRGKTD